MRKGILNLSKVSTKNVRSCVIVIAISGALASPAVGARSENPAPSALTGSWGGVGAGLEAPEGEEPRIELDCAHGSIKAPLTVAADGSFDWRGTFVPERGGPARQGTDTTAMAARYRGTLDGDRLLLTIEPASGKIELELFRNRAPRIRKCR